MITTKIIYLDKVADITRFAEEAHKVAGDVIVRRGKFVVDGKSIMGIISINPSEGVTVEYPEDETAFGEFLATLDRKG